MKLDPLTREPKTPYHCPWSSSLHTQWECTADEPNASFNAIDFHVGWGRTPQRAIKHLKARIKRRLEGRQYEWEKY